MTHDRLDQCLGYLRAETDPDCSILRFRILPRKTGAVAFRTRLFTNRRLSPQFLIVLLTAAGRRGKHGPFEGTRTGRFGS